MKKLIILVFSLSFLVGINIFLPKVIFAQQDSQLLNQPLIALPLTTSSVSFCNINPPQFSPDLLQINTSSSSATLYFVPVKDDISGYIIKYGYTPNDTGFMVGFIPDNPNWIISHKVDSLYPNTTYYFKVSAIDGCASGPWSNTLKVTTPAQNQTPPKTFYKGLISIMNDTIQISSKGKNILSIPLPFSKDEQQSSNPKDKNWLIDTISTLEDSFNL